MVTPTKVAYEEVEFLPPPPERLEPEGRSQLRELGIAVIEMAFRDLVSPFRLRIGSKEWRETRSEAIRFLLSRNKDLEFWCEVADMPVAKVLGAARKRLLEVKNAPRVA